MPSGSQSITVYRDNTICSNRGYDALRTRKHGWWITDPAALRITRETVALQRENCDTYRALAIEVNELLLRQEDFDYLQMTSCYSPVQWRFALKEHGQAQYTPIKHAKVDIGHCKLVNSQGK